MHGGDALQIETYCEKYRDAVIALILTIQNREAKIGLTLREQPDLMQIRRDYQQSGGEFWVAVHDGAVIGTIGLMRKGSYGAVLKKFFVKKEFRSQKIGLSLYRTLLAYAQKAGIRQIVLDTPSVAKVSHRFYEKAGFKKISKAELPFPYTYPDRDSMLYLLDL